VVKLRRIALAFACAAPLVLGLAACGKPAYPDHADANNSGGYVQAGLVTYQLQISRQLNQYSEEDRSYFLGVSPSQLGIGPQDMWFGVFLWAKNQTHVNATTASDFDIVDTQGNHYYPIPINPALNPYAYEPTTLEPLGVLPIPGTTAFFGPTQGMELLFKINQGQVYANRPLTLRIHVPGSSRVSTISLDL
jgi:hypothetical protein